MRKNYRMVVCYSISEKKRVLGKRDKRETQRVREKEREEEIKKL